MSAEKVLFRCSSLGHLMTDPKEKAKKEAGELAEIVKTHLIDVFLSYQYNRKEEMQNKYLDKGNAREQDSITLLTNVDKVMYRKNGKRLKNDFITGEPDLFLGEFIESADETIDLKTSWSAHTFFRAKYKELEKLYKWQGIGYMALTGAKRHTVAYCLVNGTGDAILSEKRILGYKTGMLDIAGNESEKYKEMCRQIEINHIFDYESFKAEYPYFEFHNKSFSWDIDYRERLFKMTIERNEDEIEKLYERIGQCRKWMNENLFTSKLLTQ